MSDKIDRTAVLEYGNLNPSVIDETQPKYDPVEVDYIQLAAKAAEKPFKIKVKKDNKWKAVVIRVESYINGIAQIKARILELDC